MRVLLFVVLLSLTGAAVVHAETPRRLVACTRALACMASGARTVEAAPTRRPVTLTLRSTSTTEYSPLAGALRARVRPAVSATEMPAVWKSLRSAVYHQMPHHETKTFSLVAAPVVIDGAFDTVPGLGLAGAF